MLYDKNGRQIATAGELAQMLGLDPSNIRNWKRAGELKPIVESSRRVYYHVERVLELNAEKIERRRKRGGAPRKGTAA